VALGVFDFAESPVEWGFSEGAFAELDEDAEEESDDDDSDSSWRCQRRSNSSTSSSSEGVYSLGETGRLHLIGGTV
jgi:hypothetical protein